MLLFVLLGCSGSSETRETLGEQPATEGVPTVGITAAGTTDDAPTATAQPEQLDEQELVPTATVVPTSPPTIVPTNVPQVIEPVAPIQFVGYMLQEEPDLSGDGWKGYRVAIAFENTTGYVLPHTLISFEGDPWVETVEGETYDAYIVQIRDGRILTNPQTAIDLTKTDYRQTVPLPPEVLVTAQTTHTMVGFYRDSWAAVFQVPEMLTPAQLVIPGYEAISLDAIAAQIETQDLGALEVYATLPAERDTQDGMVGMAIGLPRLVLDGNRTLLAVDINVGNMDLTENREVDYSFSLVDATGRIASNYQMFCDGSTRDFVLEDVLPVIGPGQVREGIVCFMLGEDSPSTYEGDYVLSVHLDDLLESYLLDDVSLADQAIDLSGQDDSKTDTPPQSVLGPEDIWWQAEYGVQVKSVSFDPGCDGIFGFELVLYFPPGTSTWFDDEYFVVEDNLGNSYTNIWWNEGPSSQNCYLGESLDDNIQGAGVTGFAGRILGEFPAGVDFLTIELAEFGQVRNAQWEIDIP